MMKKLPPHFDLCYDVKTSDELVTKVRQTENPVDLMIAMANYIVQLEGEVDFYCRKVEEGTFPDCESYED